MPHELEIECAGYSVFIEGKDRDVFERVKDVPEVEDKELLVTALLELLPPEGILSVSRKTADGKFCDGPDGEPGYQQFNPEKAIARSRLVDGQMKESNQLLVVVEKHYKDGLLNNTPDGEAAYREFDDSGKPTAKYFYVDDVQNDGPNGEPARWKVDADNGNISIWHYKDGKTNDLLDGTPAFQEFSSSGKLLKVSHYINGKGNDALDGTPAWLKFNEVSGELCSAVRRKDDEWAKKWLKDKAVRNIEKTPAVQALKKLHP